MSVCGISSVDLNIDINLPRMFYEEWGNNELMGSCNILVSMMYVTVPDWLLMR